jgi:hypothetical protein
VQCAASHSSLVSVRVVERRKRKKKTRTERWRDGERAASREAVGAVRGVRGAPTHTHVDRKPGGRVGLFQWTGTIHLRSGVAPLFRIASRGAEQNDLIAFGIVHSSDPRRVARAPPVGLVRTRAVSRSFNGRQLFVKCCSVKVLSRFGKGSVRTLQCPVTVLHL